MESTPGGANLIERRRVLLGDVWMGRRNWGVLVSRAAIN